MTLAWPAPALPRADTDTRWRRHGLALALTTVVLLAVFRSDVRDLVHLWWTSTTFGHCLFIPPVLIWLVWQRRAGLAELRPAAWWPGLALVAAGGFGWLLGDAAGVALARQLGLVMMVQGATVTLLGPLVARALMFPLAYMIFLVPFGEDLEPPLQSVTAAAAIRLLHVAQVPATLDGVLIRIPGGWFEVAEACSGAKFVIAMLAYGVLVANVCYVSWRRRALFMVVALIVPVLANCLRAFGTIYAAYWTSVEAATGYDHIVYGWVFFGLVMAGVLALGWRWFDRDPDAPWFDVAALRRAPPHRIDLAPAVALVLTVAAAFVAWSGAIASRADAMPPRLYLPEVPGWHRVAMSTAAPWSPNYPGADHFLLGRYDDGRGVPVDLALAVYGSQREGRELIAFGQGAIREDDTWVRVEDLAPIDGGATLRMTDGGAERIVGTWYRIGGVTTASDGRAKLETLRLKLLGGRQRAAAVLLSAEARPGADARGAIARFLAAAGEPGMLADRIVERR